MSSGKPQRVGYQQGGADHETDRRGIVSVHMAPAGGGGAPSCTFTRQELQELLKESRFGEDQGAYGAYFRADPSGDGGHVCRACGLAVGQHTAAVPAAVVATASSGSNDADTLSKVPFPDVNYQQLATLFDESDGSEIVKMVPRPRHWKGGMWFMNFLEFDGFSGLHQELAGSRKHKRLVTYAQTRWRCVAPDADHTGPCGETFVTKGVLLDSTTLRPGKRTVASMDIVHASEHAFRDHFTEAHKLESTGPGRWSTGLGDVCAHPASAIACLLCPLSVPYFCGVGSGAGFCNVLNGAAPTNAEGESVITGGNPDGMQCSGGCWCSHLVMIPFIPHAVALGALTFGLSILTVCGFPCNSDGLPPLILCCCYQRRRQFIRALEVDETPMQTRCITVFCCPCSECQQFRELRNSGVWPGLACCTASEEDKQAMAPSAVRERFAVDGAYGVRGRAAGGPLAQRTASLLDQFPGPNVAWDMQ